MESKQYLLAKRMRWTGRVIGLFTAGFFLAFLIGEAISEVLAEDWEATIGVEGILLGILVAIALAGCIISWWRQRLGGILLILASIGLGIHIGIIAERNHFLVWLIMGLPYLIAGGLILYAWWLERKAAELKSEVRE
jgi:hypothetical protein